MQVHKETIDKIPNALPNRNNVDIEIYGMEGIPENDLRQHERDKGTSEPMTYPDPSKTAAPPKPPTIPPPGMMPPLGFLPAPGTVPPFMGGMLPVPPMPYPVAPNSQYPPMPPPIPAVYPGAPPTVQAPLPPPLPNPLSVPSQAPISSGLTTISNAPAVTAAPKPLFPSVASSSNSSSVPSSSSASVSNANLTHGKIVTISANTRIIHPEDDLSLEELRTRLPRYKHLNLETAPPVQMPANGGNAPLPPPPPMFPNPIMASHVGSNMFPPAPPYMQAPSQFQQVFRPAY